MKQRIHTTPFNTGRYAQKETAEPIDKYANRSKIRNVGNKDGLMEAISSPPRLPTQQDDWSHSPRVHPMGHAPQQAGEFGRMQRTGTGQGVYGYGGNVMSARPGNAVGNPPERLGDNAIGYPPNRRGANGVGVPPNRRGPNAVGSPPNRVGESALASKWTPHGSFHGGARRS
jgi:hypothetical protein